MIAIFFSRPLTLTISCFDIACLLEEWSARYESGFFFSSRRRHTRCGRDWSSDVCSSDLESIINHQHPLYTVLVQQLAHFTGGGTFLDGHQAFLGGHDVAYAGVQTSFEADVPGDRKSVV